MSSSISSLRPPVPHILYCARPRPLLPPPGLERVLALAHQRAAVLGLGVGNLGSLEAAVHCTVLYTVQCEADLHRVVHRQRARRGHAARDGAQTQARPRTTASLLEVRLLIESL